MFLTEPKKPDVLKIYNNAIRKENKSFFQKKGVAFFPNATFPLPFSISICTVK